jgi:hypothetical protein
MTDKKITNTEIGGKELEMQYTYLNLLQRNSHYETRENHERS